MNKKEAALEIHNIIEEAIQDLRKTKEKYRSKKK